MADQFLSIQAFSGSPSLMGANTKPSGGAKSGENGEFPEVLVQAFMGGAVQGSTDHAKASNGDQSQGPKDEKGDETPTAAGTAALAASVLVQLPVLMPNSEVAGGAPSQPGSNQNETGGPFRMLASQGTTPAMEAALALMEPVSPESAETASVFPFQNTTKGKGIPSDAQGAQLPLTQEVRPVFKLLRDLALGIFSAGSSSTDGPQADPKGEIMTPMQSGQKTLASEIAQNVLTSIEKVKKGDPLQLSKPETEFKGSLSSEMSRVTDAGRPQGSSSAETVHNKSSKEGLNISNQPTGLPASEQAGSRTVFENGRSLESKQAVPVGEPVRSAAEMPRQANTEARGGSNEQGSSNGETTVLPQGTGVNATGAEREANDSLFGKNMAAAFHQQVTESAVAGMSGKRPAGGAGNAGPLMTPELSRSIVEQVARGLALQVQGKVSEMRLTLKPETLGEIAVKVRVEDGKMQAQIDVSQPAVKAVVETNLPQLRQALSDNGIEVQRIDVFATTQDSARESNGSRGEKPKHRGGRRGGAAVEATEPGQATRMMGYNTMEIII